jgi:hypothetical protein
MHSAVMVGAFMFVHGGVGEDRILSNMCVIL